ncbi:hypothetical protein GCM10007857_78650 [Bradyrhizobium iriomotense]|uniref:Uncharacterized protein n=1 Tax=Bradyrhizobium iriomotense TaxID=441950 RepID=A0ABQ6B9V2_9BRAD|nr:hypothetical protein GCM10007857_78650 [Bradyrhizobium iriomotense]
MRMQLVQVLQKPRLVRLLLFQPVIVRPTDIWGLEWVEVVERIHPISFDRSEQLAPKLDKHVLATRLSFREADEGSE